MSAGDGPRKALKGSQDYLRYTTLGLTMMGIVVLSTLLGRCLDRLIAWPWPVLTIVFALLGIVGAMLHLFKETRPR